MTLAPPAVRDEASATASPAANPTTRRKLMLDVITLIVASIVFLALCLYQLDLPGLYPDEAFDVVAAMQILLGHPVDVQRGAALHLFGTDLPLMSSSDYQGVTSTYLVLPFFALGGVNVYSLRVMTILVGLLGLILSFFLAKAWFGPTEARIAALLMAVSPAWVFWSRVGVYVVSEVVPIAVGALLALTIWVHRRPFASVNISLYVAAFLIGLGLATKLLFLWIMVALAYCGFVLYARPAWENRSKVIYQWKHWLRVTLCAGLAFCLGAFPFLLYNILTRGTYHLLMNGLTSPTTTHGVNNSAFVRNLWTEADAFKVLLDGGYFWFQGVAGRVYSNPLTPAIFALSAVGLIAIVLAQHSLAAKAVGNDYEARLRRLTQLTGKPPKGGFVLLARCFSRRALWTLFAVNILSGAIWWFGGAGRPEGPNLNAPLGLWPIDLVGIIFWLSGAALMLLLGFDPNPVRNQRAMVASLTIIGLVVAQSAVTISGLWSTHLIVLLPLPQIVIAAFAVAAYVWIKQGSKIQNPKSKIVPALPTILLILPILAFDVGVDYSYHRDLALTGGNTTFSDSIYKLADYLDEQNPNPTVVAMDWGFKRPIQLLTQDRVNPVEIYGYSPEPTEAFRTGLREFLKQPNALYVFHTPESTAYPRFDAFQEEARAAGKTVDLQQTFYLRDGKPNYLVYRVRE